MDHEAIQEIINKKIKELARLGKKISKDFDKDTIHNFRLAAKTLRSFLRLLRTYTHEPKLEISKEFKRLYHITGAIRDAQLELENIAEKHLTLPRYTAKLVKMISRQQQEWGKHYTPKIFSKLTTKLLAYKYDKMQVQVLENFFRSGMKYLQEFSKVANPTESQIHNVRKRIKDILYTMKPAKKKWKEAQKLVQQIPLEQLELIADQIGNYHDQSVILQRLSSFSPKGIEDDEKNTIKTICLENTVILAEEKIRIISAVKKITGRRKK